MIIKFGVYDLKLEQKIIVYQSRRDNFYYYMTVSFSSFNFLGYSATLSRSLYKQNIGQYTNRI